MFFEIAAVWGILAAFLLVTAEFSKDVSRSIFIGILGGLMLIMLGGWISIDGVGIRSGSLVTGSSVIAINETSGNSSDVGWLNSTSVVSKNETVTDQYQDASFPIGNFNSIFGGVIMLLGIYESVTWALKAFGKS